MEESEPIFCCPYLDKNGEMCKFKTDKRFSFETAKTFFESHIEEHKEWKRLNKEKEQPKLQEINNRGNSGPGIPSSVDTCTKAETNSVQRTEKLWTEQCIQVEPQETYKFGKLKDAGGYLCLSNADGCNIMQPPSKRLKFKSEGVTLETLKNHAIKMHGIKINVRLRRGERVSPLKCDACSKTFSRSQTLAKHKCTAVVVPPTENSNGTETVELPDVSPLFTGDDLGSQQHLGSFPLFQELEWLNNNENIGETGNCILPTNFEK